jgi:hypothetical protein
MPKKSLLETNPYLKVPEKYRQALITNVASSTAVETGASIESIARKLTKSEKIEKITTPHRSAR